MTQQQAMEILKQKLLASPDVQAFMKFFKGMTPPPAPVTPRAVAPVPPNYEGMGWMERAAANKKYEQEMIRAIDNGL